MSERLSYVICIGSNTADRRDSILAAVKSLTDVCDVLTESSIYEAPDESGIGAPYLNKVIAVEPRLAYDEFCSFLKKSSAVSVETSAQRLMA